MKEQWHQTKVQKYFESIGFKTVNLIHTNRNGIMDLLILVWNWKHFWIEMKDLKWVESPLQKFRRKEYTEHGDICLVCYWYNDCIEQWEKIKEKVLT